VEADVDFILKKCDVGSVTHHSKRRPKKGEVEPAKVGVVVCVRSGGGDCMAQSASYFALGC